MSQLAHTMRAMPTLLKVGFASMVAYRAEMVVWILTATLPLVMLALWNAVAAEGPLQGFGQAEIARYFTTALIVRQLTGAWIVWDLNYNVRTGSLSPLLLRPINPMIFNLAETVAAIPFRLVVLVPILLALVWWRPDIAFVPTPERILLGGVSVVLAFAVAWLVQAMFGMLAFWFEEALGIFGLWFVGVALFGGYVIPLPLLPDWLEAVAHWLPFQAALASPIEILVGSEADPISRVLVQLCWVGICFIGARGMWHRGIQRYGAVGA